MPLVAGESTGNGCSGSPLHFDHRGARDDRKPKPIIATLAIGVSIHTGVPNHATASRPNGIGGRLIGTSGRSAMPDHDEDLSARCRRRDAMPHRPNTPLISRRGHQISERRCEAAPSGSSPAVHLAIAPAPMDLRPSCRCDCRGGEPRNRLRFLHPTANPVEDELDRFDECIPGGLVLFPPGGRELFIFGADAEDFSVSQRLSEDQSCAIYVIGG